MPIGSPFRRLLYAVKFQEQKILLSSYVNSDSRILYDRSPRDRVQKVAPWLTLDGDPYPAVVDGRVIWIVDGYTTSDGYPYSTGDHAGRGDVGLGEHAVAVRSRCSSARQINYIRNSVKATVDAYDGTVTLYAWDATDPVLQDVEQGVPEHGAAEVRRCPPT